MDSTNAGTSPSQEWPPGAILPDAAETARFLDALGQRRHALVAIKPDTRILTGAQFMWPEQSDQLMAWVERHNTGDQNVYYTLNAVAPAFRGTKPAKGDVTAALAGHADLDPVHENAQELAAERERLMALADELAGCTSLVVDSGGGLHPLWLLAKPEPDWQPVELTNVQLEAALGGKGTHNIDRILRLPGTINWPDQKKRDIGRVPSPARLLHASGKRFTVAEVAAIAERLRETPPPHARPVPRSNGALFDQPAATTKPKAKEPEPEPEDEAAYQKTLDLILETFNEFHQTWEKDKLPRFDGSHSGFELSLARQLHRMGRPWPFIVWALHKYGLKWNNLSHHNEHELARIRDKLDGKALWPDTCTREQDRAQQHEQREQEQEQEREQKKQEREQTKADAQTPTDLSLADLKLGDFKVRKLGAERGCYELHPQGYERPVTIGNIDNLMNFRIVQNSLIEVMGSKGIMKRDLKKLWLFYGSMISDAAEVIDLGTEREQTREWVEGFLHTALNIHSRREPKQSPSWSTLAALTATISDKWTLTGYQYLDLGPDDGRVAFRHCDLLVWLNQQRIQISHVQLSERLSRAGFTSWRPKAARGVNNEDLAHDEWQKDLERYLKEHPRPEVLQVWLMRGYRYERSLGS